MKILLAVSGGIDSMTMADMCVSHSCLMPEAGYSVAHCNFHLRPGECDGDESLVREWAGEHGLDFFCRDFDTEKYAADNGISIEMAARELRYAWFAELVREHSFDALAVAHNLNDDAETLFLNLLRGTGPRGLCGMGSRTVMDFPEGPLTVLRPLLGLTRKQIEEYAEANGVPYRTDRTNLENDYKRNRLRNLVFPMFEEMNPSFLRTMESNMAHFRDAAVALEGFYKSACPKVVDCNGDISLDALKAIEGWEYVLYRILDGKGFNSSSIESLTSLVASSDRGTFAGKTFSGVEADAVTTSGRIQFVPHVRARMQYLMEEMDYLPGMSLKTPEGVLLMDKDALPEGFEVREWLPGDWFVPFGMKGRKKLSDFFSDTHTSIADKAAALVVAAPGGAGRVYAVLGRRIDDSVKVTSSTRRILKFFQPEN